MAEMIVSAPEVKKIVHDYDFMTTSGMLLPFTIDLEAGDTIDIGKDVIKVHLVEQVGFGESSPSVPAQDCVIFVDKLLSFQHRKREMVELTPEQRFEWEKVLKTTNKSKAIH